METLNSLLNLPGSASAAERACAVHELMLQSDNITAACRAAEQELQSLREQTAELFTESICAARGVTDAEAAADIRAAWVENPAAALAAFAGEEVVTASNPYGCNQWGHEWAGKHGEGWRGNRQQGKKKEETAEERTKRIVVGSIKDAKSTLEELNKKLGKPPYDINDPRARAKINLEHDLKRTEERDTEEAAERLKQTTERAKKALSKVSSLTDEINKTMKEIDEAGDKAALPNGKVDKEQADKAINLQKKLYRELAPKLKKLKEEKNLSDSDKKKIDNTLKEIDEHSKPKLRTTTSKERRQMDMSYIGLSDALKKIAPRTDKNGQGLMPFAKKHQ